MYVGHSIWLLEQSVIEKSVFTTLTAQSHLLEAVLICSYAVQQILWDYYLEKFLII